MKDKIIKAIKDSLLGEFVGNKKVIDVSVSFDEESFEEAHYDTIEVMVKLEGKKTWINALYL